MNFTPWRPCKKVFNLPGRADAVSSVAGLRALGTGLGPREGCTGDGDLAADYTNIINNITYKNKVR